MKLFRNSHLLFISFFVILLSGSFQAFAQKNEAKLSCIAFYNLENLFDTIDDPKTNDAEFLPSGKSNWTRERYNTKLAHMASVIAQIGSGSVAGGPSVIGLAEVENLGVLEDLIKTAPLDKMDYQIVHYDSPDERGIDVGLLYKPSVFKVIHTTSNRLTIAGQPEFLTRDQLVVTGELDGDQISIIVNHWPSRYSGPEYRAEAAKLSRHLIDSLAVKHKKAKIFLMGDLNDDPADSSVAVVLGAKGQRAGINKGELYNPMWEIHQSGKGSLTYKGKWNLFDQIIISEPLISRRGRGWKFQSAGVYNEKFLLEQEGKYAGNPFRTFAGGKYLNGYSDHLPTFLILSR
ncbi:MAG: endonuclease/exonuclease/phosphatase family protein [Lentimicrobium sp.]|nr:endonuclease/exonuclease/phosphatase family protein [Lentimicrobium sp.]